VIVVVPRPRSASAASRKSRDGNVDERWRRGLR
jgi:hypothetical protein